MSPVTDFYKTLALDCAGDQVAIDLFILTGQYVDLASLCKYLYQYILFLLLISFYVFISSCYQYCKA